ncbi:MAG: polymerase sigma factor, FliA/WhiG family/RNA polymerase sigma factor, sigma-70 family, partial [Bryobacterales bacterium]|nr:polymerase sigma factor, FliA/WhiG family/RNA polymerase sigma factor, sigma-70 family [Bryobacterales bacterium]
MALPKDLNSAAFSTERAKVVSIEAGSHRARLIERRNELVMSHLDLVESVARSVFAGLPPTFLLEDLIQTGRVALLDAATRYRPQQHGGAPFSAFARQVVRGAILNSTRRRH